MTAAWRCLALAALGLTGCATVMPQQGTPAPPPPPRVVVADIPGVDDAAVFAPWNALAGYELFGNGPDPDITFVAHAPICYGGNCDDRRQAGVVDRGAGRHEIFYDDQLVGPLAVEVWQHEFGHIVIHTIGDTGCENPYRGVMSYCEFWTTRPGWFGDADRQLLRDNGL